MENIVFGILFLIVGFCAVAIGVLILFSDAARGWFARWKYVGLINNERETGIQRALTRYLNGPVLVIVGVF